MWLITSLSSAEQDRTDEVRGRSLLDMASAALKTCGRLSAERRSSPAVCAWTDFQCVDQPSPPGANLYPSHWCLRRRHKPSNTSPECVISSGCRSKRPVP